MLINGNNIPDTCMKLSNGSFIDLNKPYYFWTHHNDSLHIVCDLYLSDGGHFDSHSYKEFLRDPEYYKERAGNFIASATSSETCTYEQFQQKINKFLHERQFKTKINSLINE